MDVLKGCYWCKLQIEIRSGKEEQRPNCYKSGVKGKAKSKEFEEEILIGVKLKK